MPPPPTIQAKIEVGAVDDPLEHEADRVADQVMRMPEPDFSVASVFTQVSRKCTACEKDEEEGKQQLQMKPADKASAHSADVAASVHNVLQSPGQALEPATRAFFEPRFGREFSRVRIHTDARAAASARAIGAVAFTAGDHLVFREGHYQPSTLEGRRLLAHELTHVAQQAPTGKATSVPLGTHGQNPATLRRTTSSTAPAALGLGGPLSSRQVDEPAGGCAVCWDNYALIGGMAHRFIQDAFKTEYGHLGAFVELRLPPSPGDENGRLDLALEIPGFDELQIGEIKPASKAGYDQGVSDMNFYRDQLQKRKRFASNLQLPVVPQPVWFFMDPTVPSCPPQKLYVNPPTPDGVYGYYCDPPRSQLAGTAPECNCDEGDASVVIAVIVLLMLLLLLKRLPVPEAAPPGEPIPPTPAPPPAVPAPAAPPMAPPVPVGSLLNSLAPIVAMLDRSKIPVVERAAAAAFGYEGGADAGIRRPSAGGISPQGMSILQSDVAVYAAYNALVGKFDSVSAAQQALAVVQGMPEQIGGLPAVT